MARPTEGTPEPTSNAGLLRQLADVLGDEGGSLIFVLKRGDEFETYRAGGMGACQAFGEHSIAVVKLEPEEGYLLQMIGRSFAETIERSVKEGKPKGRWIIGTDDLLRPVKEPPDVSGAN